MIVRMTHPDHGATHVYSSAEQKAHEERGWKVDGEAIEEPKPRGRPRKAP